MSDPGTTLTIRRARLDEAAALTDLSLRSKASNGYDDAFMELCVGELTVTPERIRDRTYWVAEDDAGVLCGCVCLGGSDHAGEVHAFFVDPNHKRRGIGRLLWQQVLEQATKDGLGVLRLDADPAAVPFYESLGFRVTRMVPSGSIQGRELPEMEVSLPSAIADL